MKKNEVNVPIQLVIDMQNDRTYYKRILDKVLDLKLRAFGATNIVGPKWCGKTETALQKNIYFIQNDLIFIRNDLKVIQNVLYQNYIPLPL